MKPKAMLFLLLTLVFIAGIPAGSVLAANGDAPVLYKGKTVIVRNVSTDTITKAGNTPEAKASQVETPVTASVEAAIDGKDVTIGAPEDGFNITMTVDGVETPIARGTYTGEVVIKRTREIGRLYNSVGTWVHILTGGVVPAYRAALYVHDGAIDEAVSVPSAMVGATYDQNGIAGGAITSKNDLFNGIVIQNSRYTIKDIKMDLTGNGGNDFEGYGAGIGVFGASDVTVDHADITTRGVVRSAVFAGSDANPLKSTTGGFRLTIKDSTLTSYAGDDAQAMRASGKVNGMETVPWVLGLSGNSRMMNTAGWGEVTYENCKVKSEGWGVLSTDDVVAPGTFGQYTMKVTARNCDIEVFGKSGYGSYSIGACYNTFDNCRIKVPSYALILADEYAGGEFRNGTVVDSDRFGVMWHTNQGGVLNVSDTTFNTGLAAFLVKGAYAVINVDRSTIHAANGVILQLMDSDDPGLFAEKSIVDRTSAVKDETHDITASNANEETIFSFKKNQATDLQANFSNMKVKGNFFNSTTNAPVSSNPYVKRKYYCKNLILSYDNVKLTGLVSSSAAKHLKYETIGGEKVITKEHYDWLGLIENSVSPAVNNGVIVTLKNGSVWTVTGSCHLTALTLADTSSIVGAGGRKVTLAVDKKPVPLVPGTYKGDILIRLTE